MKKRLFFISFLVLSFICGSYLSGTDESVVDEQNRNYLQAFLDFFEERMKTEFDLELKSSVGVPFNQPDRVPYLSFNAYRRASLDEARAFEMAVLSRMAETAQAFERSYREPHSFSVDPEFVRASIDFIDLQVTRDGIVNKGRRYNDGSISSVALHKYPDNLKDWKLHYTAKNAFRNIIYFEEDSDDDFPSSIYESPEEVERLNALSSITNPTIHRSQPFDQELDKIAVMFKGEREKQGLYIRALGWMEPGQTTDTLFEIRASGTYYGIVGLNEARALMLERSERLLHLLNDNAALRPYFVENPFPASRLKFRILFRHHKPFVGPVPDTGKGSVSSVSLDHGTITYLYFDPDSSEAVSRQEAYQEAQEILENTPAFELQETSAHILRQVKYWWGQFWNFISALIFAFFTFIYALLGVL